MSKRSRLNTRWQYCVTSLACLAAYACSPSAPTATRTLESVQSTPERAAIPLTQSPQPDAIAPVLPSCDRMDRGLREVAEVALADYQRSGRLMGSEQLTFHLRRAGLPYVWVRSWAASGADENALRHALSTWLESAPASAERRCGWASGTSTHSTNVVGLVVDVLVDVSPIPRAAGVGSWLPLHARLLVPAKAALVTALGPRGEPHSVVSRLSPSGVVEAQLPLASPGRWLFQVLADTTASGPRPTAEVEVFVDAPLPEAWSPMPVPGERPRQCSTLECMTRLLADMLNDARASEGLPALKRSVELENLAAEHATAMQRAQTLAHDLGQGDPYIRATEALPELDVLGENVAHGDTPQAVHRALWQSPAHRKNLLDRRYSHLGVGVALGPKGDVWSCQLFARYPASAPPN